jgi:Brp/Blh family beta-carotene 15,15'-monooxygenase
VIALAPAQAAIPWCLLAWALAWALAWGLAGPAALGPQLIICVPVVAALGVPHGATDWWLAADRLPRRLGRRLARFWPVCFAAAYLLGGLAAVAMIVASPVLALVAFITGSVWHFGAHDARAHGLTPARAAWLCCGLPVIAAPLAFRPADAAALLHAMGVAASAPQIAMAGAACLLLAAATATGLPAWPPAWRTEIAALLLLCALAPPLPAFTAYFCVVHAPRQFRDLRVTGRLAAALSATAAACVLIALPLALAARAGRVAPTQAGIQAVFWGLAVLTLPHTLCGWLLAAAPIPSTPPTHAFGGIQA